MSFYLRDANGYLRDAGSIGGISETWETLKRAGGVVRAFLGEGKSRVPLLLADGLASFLERSEGISEASRAHIENLIAAAREAEGILILTDGTDDRDEEAVMKELEGEVLNFYTDADLVNYAQVKRDLDALEDKAREHFLDTIAAIQGAFAKRMRTSLNHPTQLPYMSDFHDTLNELMQASHRFGRHDGRQESVRRVFETDSSTIRLTFGNASFTPKAAIKWLKEKELYVAGVFSDGLLKGIKNLLINALKVGTSTGELIEKLYDLFDPYLGSTKLKEGIPPEPYKLSTMIRTVTTEAYNHGRLTEYLDPELAPYMQGVRYSAILDDRTSAVCRYLDGRVFKLNDPDLPGLTPPNHFNCRSLLVPVVKGEKVEQKEFITPAQRGRAKGLADVKFLEQE